MPSLGYRKSNSTTCKSQTFLVYEIKAFLNFWVIPQIKYLVQCLRKSHYYWNTLVSNANSATWKKMSKTSSTRNLAFVSCESCKCIQKKWESYMLSSVCMWSLVSVQRSHLLRKSSTAGHDYSPSTTWCCHWSHMKTFLPLLVYPFKGEGITDFVRLLCIWRAWPSSYRKTYYIRGPTKQLYLWKMTVLAGSTRRKRPRNWQVIQMTGVSQQSVCVCHSKNILSVTDSRKKERVPEHICSNSSRKSYLSEAKWGGAR